MEFYEEWVCTDCGDSHDDIVVQTMDGCPNCGSVRPLAYVCGHYEEMSTEEYIHYNY